MLNCNLQINLCVLERNEGLTKVIKFKIRVHIEDKEYCPFFIEYDVADDTVFYCMKNKRGSKHKKNHIYETEEYLMPVEAFLEALKDESLLALEAYRKQVNLFTDRVFQEMAAEYSCDGLSEEEMISALIMDSLLDYDSDDEEERKYKN